LDKGNFAVYAEICRKIVLTYDEVYDKILKN